MEEIQPAPDEGTVVYPITFKVLYIQTVVGLGSSEPSTLLGIYIYMYNSHRFYNSYPSVQLGCE